MKPLIPAVILTTLALVGCGVARPGSLPAAPRMAQVQAKSTGLITQLLINGQNAPDYASANEGQTLTFDVRGKDLTSIKWSTDGDDLDKPNGPRYRVRFNFGGFMYVVSCTVANAAGDTERRDVKIVVRGNSFPTPMPFPPNPVPPFPKP
ncbi:MAG: hypothetical protein VKP62_14675 [Candidatus Sericytochromatia bacterium]|nr:hypothetical protein [Candidatus Sericytochromatia bacterium]